jgi:hypothetical protein
MSDTFTTCVRCFPDLIYKSCNRRHSNPMPLVVAELFEEAGAPGLSGAGGSEFRGPHNSPLDDSSWRCGGCDLSPNDAVWRSTESAFEMRVSRRTPRASSCRARGRIEYLIDLLQRYYEVASMREGAMRGISGGIFVEEMLGAGLVAGEASGLIWQVVARGSRSICDQCE